MSAASGDRITLAGPGMPYGDPDDVDEVVFTGTTHLEMLDAPAAYLHLARSVDEVTALGVRARRMTRDEHRETRRRDGTRARDLPTLAASWVHPRGLVARWRAALELWWQSRRRASVLVVTVHDDELGLVEERGES